MNDPRSFRDWMLTRHQPAVVRLDTIRRTTLPPANFTWRDFIGELFLPQRTVWSALAAVWIALALFHFTQRQARPTPLPKPPATEAVATWLAQLKAYETFAKVDRRP